MIRIKDVRARVEGKEILKGFSLDVEPGEVHAIMGPNGAGKSTLAKVLAGHPAYEVEGRVLMGETDLLALDPEERARAGLFMSFQYPIEIRGISNYEFLYQAYKAIHGEEKEFRALIQPILTQMKIRDEFLERDLNDGFSGGEKKRNEILQLLALRPKVAILDETDSGLDIDALKVVGDGINHYRNQERSVILITHYQRLLNYVKPDKVHMMIDGKIVESGGPELALRLEEEGYEACKRD